MKTCIILLVAVCALSYHSASAGECHEEFKKVAEMMESIYDETECAVELDLKKYKCTGGEDVEKDKEIQQQFFDWYKSADEPTQTKTKDCMKEMGAVAMEKAEASDECKQKMTEMYEMIAAKLDEE